MPTPTAAPTVSGDALRKAREALDISQSEAARRLSIAAYQVCRYESGVNVPPANVLGRIAQLYNVPIDSLFVGKSAAA